MYGVFVRHERSFDCDIIVANSMGVEPAPQFALPLTMCASSCKMSRRVISGFDFVLALPKKTGVPPKSWLKFSEYTLNS